ncbi:hypothetical protein HZB96_05725 [Candidatus Gottesmanbacteria bacterium]|nr:hypothetical protein [Candidatus Gottesmanbacteria bacterium]
MAVFSQPHYPPFGAPSVMDTAVIFSPELRQKFETILQVLIEEMENYMKQTGNMLPKDIKEFLDIYTAEKTYFLEKPEKFVTAKFFLEKEINLRLMLLSKNILEEIKSLQATAGEANLNNGEMKRLVDKYGLDQLSLSFLSTFPLLQTLILSYKKQQPAKIKPDDLPKDFDTFSEYKGYLEDIDPKGGDFRKFSLFVTEIVKVQLEFYKALEFTYYELDDQILEEDNFRKRIIQKFIEQIGNNIYQERLNKLSDKDLLLLKAQIESEFEEELLNIQSGSQTLTKNLPQEVVIRAIKAHLEELRQKEEADAVENVRRQLQQI